MPEYKYLYIMLSRTGTGMGKVIRLFTHCRYNHVSLTLASDLRSFVSFARYTKGVALAGGFVRETVERFLSDNQPVPVCIFRVEISPERYKQLNSLFSMAESKTDLIYNSLGALLSTWHLLFHIPGAYTCLEFAAAVLGMPFRSLQELQAYLQPNEIFQGNLNDLVQDNADRSDGYFTRRGFLRGTADTVVHFTRLAGRLLRLSKCHDPIAML
jgi:hypothetical protein